MSANGSDWQPGAPPCATCGTWPERFWLVEGRNESSRTSFGGHHPSLEAAEKHLDEMVKEHPEYTRWQIEEMVPGVIAVGVWRFVAEGGRVRELAS